VTVEDFWFASNAGSLLSWSEKQRNAINWNQLEKACPEFFLTLSGFDEQFQVSTLLQPHSCHLAQNEGAPNDMI
jgi:hypothetical protein